MAIVASTAYVSVIVNSYRSIHICSVEYIKVIKYAKKEPGLFLLSSYQPAIYDNEAQEWYAWHIKTVDKLDFFA